jgi:hypothetical protein
MKTFRLSYIFDGWDVRFASVKAASFSAAKQVLRKRCKGKCTSITAA